MPRPIVMTEEMKQKARNDFNAVLDGVKMSDGKLSYSINYKYDADDVVVWLTQKSYRKTVALVTGFSDEVGWHGSVTRVGEREFVVDDIFVYPQEVTGSTVNTDQEAYTKWLYELDDEIFNTIRMQGHSHVNMGVTPSGVDDRHRQGILEQLEPDMFYIFMIWNKSLSVHALVYDMANNVMYENRDIEVKLLNDEEMDGFLADAKEKVQKRADKKRRGERVSHNQIVLDGLSSDYQAYEKYNEHEKYHEYEHPSTLGPFDPYHYFGGGKRYEFI